MKFTTFAKTLAATVGVAMVGFLPATAAAVAPGSVPYQAEQTNGPATPAFNIFTGVPSVGNEGDFVRLKKVGAANSTLTNTLDTTCKTGDKFVVWFYVHNGANPGGNDNGNGPAVAKNVVAKVALPTGEMTSFPISGSITSSNSDPLSISDNATISCGGNKFTLGYVNGTATAFLDKNNTNVAIADSIVTTGASIGSIAGQSSVWACWEERVWMALTVEVKEVPPAKVPATCDLLDMTTKGNLSVIINKLDYTANDATVTGVSVDFGDNTTPKVLAKTDLPYTYTYAAAGNYSVRATVKTSMGDVTSSSCVASITTSKPVPPKTPQPPVVRSIPNTGAGSTIGIFSGLTLAGALAHNFLTRRRANR